MPRPRKKYALGGVTPAELEEARAAAFWHLRLALLRWSMSVRSEADRLAELEQRSPGPDHKLRGELSLLAQGFRPPRGVILVSTPEQRPSPLPPRNRGPWPVLVRRGAWPRCDPAYVPRSTQTRPPS